MGEHRRKADGRRVFSTEFKRTAVQRILTGEKTLAELSRELDISPSVIRNWKRFAEAGATTAVQASEDVVPASQLREAYAKIRELERALGRKTMEVEILRAPHAIQWLSDNGPQYTATATVLYAHELGLVPITTPAYSPESNGLAEAFIGTFKRDYVDGAELRDAETVLARVGGWFEDYNTRAPHSALGMRSPHDYRAVMHRTAVNAATTSRATPHLAQDARSPAGPLSEYPPKIGLESVRASS
jgi:transposase-like protein